MSMAVLKYSFVYGHEHLNFIYLSLVTKYYYFDFFFNHLVKSKYENGVYTIRNPWTLQKQTADHMWPLGHSLPTTD